MLNTNQMKVKFYTPIVKPVVGSCFSVNGATNRDEDEAIRLTKRHVEFRNPGTVILRIDIHEEYVDEICKCH